ncbi:uncharacterized protein PHA67_006541 [Liasis olivaceus]
MVRPDAAPTPPPGISSVIPTLCLVAGPGRRELSMLLALRPEPPRFSGGDVPQRVECLKMQLGLSLVTAQDGFQIAAHLQIQSGNPGIGDQGGSLLAWNFNFHQQWTRRIQRGCILYYALRLFSNWWRIPAGGLQVSSAFQRIFLNFAGLSSLHISVLTWAAGLRAPQTSSPQGGEGRNLPHPVGDSHSGMLAVEVCALPTRDALRGSAAPTRGLGEPVLRKDGKQGIAARKLHA